MDKRREEALLDWTVYDGEWSRPNRGLWWGAWNAPIRGPFGDVLRNAVQSHFEGGRGRQYKNSAGEVTGEGYPLRWERILQMVNPGWNLMQILAGKNGPGRLDVLYRDASRIGVPGSLWPLLREKLGLDPVLGLKQKIGIACRSSGVGVTVASGAIGLRVFRPHEVTFEAAPWNPLEAITAIHHKSDHVIVSTKRDARNPIWGRWRSVEEFRDGSPPVWSLQGPDYPFRYGNEVLLHIIATPGNVGATELQPSASDLRHVTIDSILQLGHARFVGRVGSFNRLVGTSEGEKPEGLDELSLDPLMVNWVWGVRAPQVQVIQNSVDAAVKLQELCLADTQAMLSVIDGDLRVRATETGVQSGRAIEIERAGIDGYARQQMRLQRPHDQRIVMLIIAAWNWGVTNRVIDPGLMNLPAELIPTVQRPTIDYPLVWSQNERTQIAKDMEPIDPVGASMIRAGTDPSDPIARDKAYTELLASTRQRVELCQAGYSVPAQVLFTAGQLAPPAEDGTTTYPVPSDVQTSASKGLMLRGDARWKGRAMVGLAATDLLTRARALLEQVPQTIGKIRILSSWLLYHGNDEDLEQGDGEWGNDNNPSGPWIVWLSQGGDAAVAWCSSVLDNSSIPADIPDIPPTSP